jgi:F-box protein 11
MKLPAIKPAALMSYTRFDDEYHDGYLSKLGVGISKEVQAHTGMPFPIFRDTQDIAWGETWEERLDHSLDTSTFLIPIITPSYVKSYFEDDWCRHELDRFLRREKQLERNDLILPVYYIEVATLENKHLHGDDPLMQTIATRRLIDWRELRFEPFSAPPVRRAIAKMAQQIAAAIQTLELEEE